MSPSSASDDVEELRRRHATFFFELAATAQDALGSQDEGAWLGRLSAEIENLRAVLAWSLDNDVGGGLRFGASLRIFWLVRGHGRELARWFEAAFQSADVVPAEIRAQALLTYGNIRTNVLGDSKGARELYEEGLRLARQMGDERLEARLLNLLGVTLRIDGNCEKALRLHEQALATFQRFGDGLRVASSLHLSGETLRDLGQFERATARYEQALAILVSLGERWAASNVIHGLGDAALEQGDAARAGDRYREAIAIAVELDDKRTVAYGLAGLSCATALAGDLSRAGTLWAASHLFEDAYGSQIRAGGRARYEHLLGEAQRAPAFVSAYERGRELTPKLALEYAQRTDDGRGGTARPTSASSA